MTSAADNRTTKLDSCEVVKLDGPLMCKVCGELADMEFGDMCAECYWYEGEGNDER